MFPQLVTPSALHRKKNSGVVEIVSRIMRKTSINVQMYVINDYATHTYTICNLKQQNNRSHITDSHYSLHLSN